MPCYQVKKLHELLKNFSSEELVTLDNGNAAWLPKLRYLHPDYIVHTICRIVENTEPELKRLEYLVSIHCWLIPLGRLEPWIFHRFNESPTLHGCIEVVARMAEYLRLSDIGDSAPHAWTVRQGSFYACFLTGSAYRHVRARFLIYMAMWTTHPLIAIHSSCAIQEKVLAAIHHALKGEIVRLNVVSHSNLAAGFKDAINIITKDSAEEGEQNTSAPQQLQVLPAMGPERNFLSPNANVTGGEKNEGPSKRSLFPCSDCWEDFDSQKALKRHCSHVHLAELKKQHFCDHCPYWNFSRLEMEAHVETHKADGNFSKKATATQPPQQTATKKAAPYPLHTCRHCGKCFPGGALPLLRHFSHCPAK